MLDYHTVSREADASQTKIIFEDRGADNRVEVFEDINAELLAIKNFNGNNLSYSYDRISQENSVYKLYNTSTGRKILEEKWKLISQTTILYPSKVQIDYEMEPGFRVDIDTAEEKASDVRSEDLIKRNSDERKVR